MYPLLGIKKARLVNLMTNHTLLQRDLVKMSAVSKNVLTLVINKIHLYVLTGCINWNYSILREKN